MHAPVRRLFVVMLSLVLLLAALPGGLAKADALSLRWGAGRLHQEGELYAQLSPRQKAGYEALEAVNIDRILTAAQVTVDGTAYRRILQQVEGVTGTEMSGSFSGGVFTPTGTSAAAEVGILADLSAAVTALRYDRPDLTWLDRLRFGYKVRQTADDRARVTDVSFDFALDRNGEEKGMYLAMMARAQEIALAAAAQTDTVERLRLIHDRLAADNRYGDPDGALSHSPYSALVAGDAYEPVCDGYAKAFKIVCDLIGVPCVTASGKDHMWNMVQLDDGRWYNIDLTWDDSGDQPGDYRYFLVGSATVIDGRRFDAAPEHTPVDPYEAYAEAQRLTPTASFRFPTASRAAWGENDPGEEPDPTPTPAPASSRFPDVSGADWFYDEVERAADLGLFTGDEQGRFLPRQNITRAQFAQVLARVYGADTAAYNVQSFTDVPAGRWYSPAVAWVRSAGLMQGYADGSFHPEAFITRQELCVVFANTYLAEPGETAAFADDADIADWAKEAVYTCRSLGLVQGDGANRFNPRGNTQRCEAAAVFIRFADLVLSREAEG